MMLLLLASKSALRSFAIGMYSESVGVVSYKDAVTQFDALSAAAKNKWMSRANSKKDAYRNCFN